MRRLDLDAARAACIGGGVFASGGGGWLEHGLQNAQTAVALGRPMLATIDEVPADGIIVTVSAIGAPAAPDWQMYPRDYIRALQLAMNELDQPVVGVMTAQNGYSTSINGWLQSAMLDLPVIDAAGDVRAHPTIKIGSMGLTRLPGYQTLQVVVGGNRDLDSYLELVTRGNVVHTSNILRIASVESGGFIASARNPISARYVKEHGALGAISLAIRLGEEMLNAEGRGAPAVIDAIVDTLHGKILGIGWIVSMDLETRGGFDHARIVIDVGTEQLTVYVLNEHMGVDRGDQRVSTFPDTIALLSTKTGMPVAVENTECGQEVAVLAVDYRQLPIASGVIDQENLREIEPTMGIELVRYLNRD